jgi:hypothetical protein
MKQSLQRAASHLNTLGPETLPDRQLHGVSRLGAVNLCFHFFLLHRKFLARMHMAQNRKRMGFKKTKSSGGKSISTPLLESPCGRRTTRSLFYTTVWAPLLYHRVGTLHAQGGE